VADHIHTIVTSCSQTLRALKVLRSQGLPAEGLFEVFRGVIIAKLLYAASLPVPGGDLLPPIINSV